MLFYAGCYYSKFDDFHYSGIPPLQFEMILCIVVWLSSGLDDSLFSWMIIFEMG